jgi:glutamyl-tRNA reductase
LQPQKQVFMGHTNNEMLTQFHDQAKDYFFSLHKEFESFTRSIDRQKEEFRFQQSKKQFAATMKRQLESLASGVLLSNKESQQSPKMNHLLQQLIKDYLHRFIQKINSF